jgi:hypothetical protein
VCPLSFDVKTQDAAFFSVKKPQKTQDVEIFAKTV